MNRDIVLLDLFSGIGGFSEGLANGGFNITKHYYSEIDKHAIAIYKQQFKKSIYKVSSTQRYKCLGNAVTVKIVELIAKRLLG